MHLCRCTAVPHPILRDACFWCGRGLTLIRWCVGPAQACLDIKFLAKKKLSSALAQRSACVLKQRLEFSFQKVSFKWFLVLLLPSVFSLLSCPCQVSSCVVRITGSVKSAPKCRVVVSVVAASEKNVGKSRMAQEPVEISSLSSGVGSLWITQKGKKKLECVLEKSRVKKERIGDNKYA